MLPDDLPTVRRQGPPEGSPADSAETGADDAGASVVFWLHPANKLPSAAIAKIPVNKLRFFIKSSFINLC